MKNKRAPASDTAAVEQSCADAQAACVILRLMNVHDPLTPELRSELRAGDARAIGDLAARAFSRATGAALITGNSVRILRDAAENYPAWLEAIGTAQHRIFFESYIIADDLVGNRFVEALCERARAGVQVRLIYDWLGSFQSGALWKRLRASGAQVRAFNPPRFDEPFGWISRDHRKMLAVDGCVGYVTGLCVGEIWQGDPAHGIEPWRDTGVEIRGPAVHELELAFAQTWSEHGPRLPASAFTTSAPVAMGEVSLRVIASEPSAAALFRLDQLIAAVASERLWLTDAYFVGVTPYVRALCAAAHDGVDVRLLVPGASDLPVISHLSRAGYRPLLEAGVRVFEWNGRMLHAKTAVADERWARVGSTNLNFASWMSNYELDVAVEDTTFARAMAEMYEADLKGATEIVLSGHNKVKAVRKGAHSHSRRALSGSAGRAAAGALTVGSAFSAALTRKRVLASTEASTLAGVAVFLCVLALIAGFWPRVLAWPIALLLAWVGSAMLWRAVKLRWRKSRRR
jgi:cardiolipin synthase